jgi:hypothetical protein
LTEPDSIPKSGLQWKQLNLVTNPGCRKKGSIIISPEQGVSLTGISSQRGQILPSFEKNVQIA